MTKYFVKTTIILSGPSDSFDGKDPIGFNILTGIYTHSTGNIEETGWFTSYTWTAGDQIWIESTTGGWSGLTEVLSKVDNNNITVTPIPGGDDQSDVTSSEGPKLTVGGGVTAASVAGDEVIICDDGTHNPTGTAVTVSTSIIFRGADGRGVLYNGSTDKATIDGGSMTAGNNIFTVSGADVDFYNLRLTDARSAAVRNDVANGDTVRMWHCRVDTCEDDGVEGRGGKVCYGCEFDNNTGIGIGYDGTSTNRGNMELFFCSMHDNSSHGAAGSGGGHFVFCEFYDNGGDGLNIARRGSWYVEYCNLSLNTSDGIGTNSSQSEPCELFVENSVMQDNGGWGINYYDQPHRLAHNVYFSNTSGTINNGVIGETDLTTDPKFTSITDGSEDFTPLAGSSLIDLGNHNAPNAGVP